MDNTNQYHDSKLWKIDTVEEPERARLWAEALQYRERVYGLVGIREIWFGMARREYNLPTIDTADARYLWATLVRNQQLVIPIVDHAAHLYRESGQIYPHLYEVCMAYWLLRNPHLAQEYHHRLLVKLRLRKLPLQRLARSLKTRFTTNSLETFMDIYRTSNERDLYDEMVPFLCDKREIVDARRWHMMCIHRGDLPSADVKSQPIIQLFVAENSIISSGSVAYPSAVTSPSDSAPQYNEKLMRRLLGRDTAAVRFEDSFCARMFATHAFSPESIISGLAAIGINEIGPQALRAMAIRTEPLSDLPKRFNDLKEAGITLEGCVFSLALEKFAMEGKLGLVRSMLNSDQHPDVFGDVELQNKLLGFYLEQKDYVQAHRTLSILTLFHKDPSTESWNLLLRASIKHFVPHRIVQILQRMRENDVLVTYKSITKISSILRSRQAGHKPGSSPRGRFDDLRFVTRLYITILESGLSPIHPTVWREIVRRYGMLGRIRELRRLLFWLLCWYAPRNGTEFSSLPKPHFLDSAIKKLRLAFPWWEPPSDLPASISQRHSHHPIRVLFSSSFQQGLIVWGFRSGLLPNASLEQSMLSSIASKKHYRRRFFNRGDLKRLHWSVGLRTLILLRDHGVNVHRHTVVKALQMLFIILFGRGRSSRKENRVMEDNNTIPYRAFVREVNEIWGSPLFVEPGRFGPSRMHSLAWYPRLRRRIHRRTWLSIEEILAKG